MIIKGYKKKWGVWWNSVYWNGIEWWVEYETEKGEHSEQQYTRKQSQKGKKL